MDDVDNKRLWAAINYYADACGGDTTQRTAHRVERQAAVVLVQRAIAKIEAKWANGMRRMIDVDKEGRPHE
jgi:hypothetical protein